MNKNDAARSIVPWVGLFAVAAMAAYARWRLLDMPLQRDEGEYAYMGWCITQGAAPYLVAANMKFPGMYFLNAAVVALTGGSIAAIHGVLLGVTFVTAGFVFLLARRLYSGPAAALAAAAFLVLTVLPGVQGVVANAEFFVLGFVTPGLYCLLRSVQDEELRWLPLAGALLGLGVLVKQHAVFFALFAVLYLVWDQAVVKRAGGRAVAGRLAVLALAMLAPFALAVAYLSAMGALGAFWLWTFDYATQYVAKVPLELGWLLLQTVFGRIVASSPALWLLAVAGGVALCLVRELRSNAPFVLGLAVFSALAVTPGLFFRPHYFVLLLPAAALLAGALAAFVLDRAMRRVPAGRRSMAVSLSALALLLCVVQPLYSQRVFLFSLGPEMACRALFGGNPFPESIPMAGYIQNASHPGDTLAILGSEPQIAYYARRRLAHDYLYIYPLTGSHAMAPDMQRQAIEDISRAAPRFVLVVNEPVSSGRISAENPFYRWAQGYLDTNYKKVSCLERGGKEVVACDELPGGGEAQPLLVLYERK